MTSGEINEQVETNHRMHDAIEEPEYNPQVFDEIHTDDEPSEEPEEQSRPQIPEKFKDKSLEDVIKSYQELERYSGKQANELGELRKLADKFLYHQLESGKAQPATPEPEPTIDLDEFVQNPDEIIKKAIQKELKPNQQKFEEYVVASEMEKSRNKVLQKHPDMGDILNNSDFASWVQASKFRQRMLAEAHFNWDADAADSLFSEWKEANKKAEASQEERVQKDLRSTVAETRGSSGSGKPKYRRTDLVNLRIQDPERFEAMQDEIQKAYAEGRVI